MRVLARALEGGTEVYWQHGQWYASSTSQPGHWCKVDPVAEACECQGAQRGIYCKHLAAVEATLTYDWSNGQTEGQINRLKMLKGQMYGRASLALLRCRFLKAA